MVEGLFSWRSERASSVSGKGNRWVDMVGNLQCNSCSFIGYINGVSSHKLVSIAESIPTIVMYRSDNLIWLIHICLFMLVVFTGVRFSRYSNLWILHRFQLPYVSYELLCLALTFSILHVKAGQFKDILQSFRKRSFWNWTKMRASKGFLRLRTWVR